MTAPKIILASSSPYRKGLMKRLGIEFKAINPEVDERALTDGKNLDARSMAVYLATEKAQSIADAHPDAIVVGSDQIAVSGATLLGKPGDKESALGQLRLLRGNTHDLITAMAVIKGKMVKNHVDTTTLHMRHLSDEALERYLEVDQPYDCAGSYKIEGLGITLFETIRGSDPTAIEGLPLAALARRLADFGVHVP